MDRPLPPSARTASACCGVLQLLKLAVFIIPLLYGFPTLANEALAERAGCLQCHGVSQKIVGPAYRDVANRYADQPGVAQVLQSKVKFGGKGNWVEVTGGITMPPYSGLLNDDEIRILVDWILSQQGNGDGGTERRGVE